MMDEGFQPGPQKPGALKRLGSVISGKTAPVGDDGVSKRGSVMASQREGSDPGQDWGLAMDVRRPTHGGL